MILNPPGATGVTGDNRNNTTPGKDDTPESLKKHLQDLNISLPDAMQVLAKLFTLDSKKVADGNASEEELNRFRLTQSLRDGSLSDSDREQLASLLGMPERYLEKVQQQFVGTRGSGDGNVEQREPPI